MFFAGILVGIALTILSKKLFPRLYAGLWHIAKGIDMAIRARKEKRGR